jgi:integrase/recombinase XerD
MSAAPLPEDLAGLVEAHLTDARARGRGAGTIGYRRVYLRQLLGWLSARGVTNPQDVSPRVLTDYLAHLRRRETAYHRAAPSRLSVRTLAAEVSVLRSFFGWLTQRRVLLFDPADGLSLGRSTSPLPKAVLTESEVTALLESPGTDDLGVRDRAILETLYSTGLRRAELCNLDLFDLDPEGGTVRVRGGKGGKDRIVPIGNHAVEALRRYLRETRPRLVTTLKQPALFVAAVTHRRLGIKTLNLIVRKRSEAAGVGTRVTPHTLRHTCATHLLQGGADVRHVQLILGHASVATTQIYTRVVVDDLTLSHTRHHPRGRLGIA